jgi:hypothetical protein
MSKPRPTSTKRQREQDKQAKARAKRDRRQRAELEADASAGVSGEPEEEIAVTEAVVLSLIDEAHRQFGNAEISFEDYDERKAALLRCLRVD